MLRLAIGTTLLTFAVLACLLSPSPLGAEPTPRLRATTVPARMPTFAPTVIGPGDDGHAAPRQPLAVPALAGNVTAGNEPAPFWKPIAFIVGRVHRAGAPARHCKIEGRPVTSTMRLPWDVHPPRVVADLEGRFVFAVYEPGPHLLWARASDGTTSPILRVDVARGAEVAQDLHFGKARVTGVVVDAWTRQPIPDAKISRGTRTDAEGRFVVEDQPPGPFAVRADHPDYVPGFGPRLDIPEDATEAELVIPLVPAGSLEGRVDSANGSPAPTGTVVLLRDERADPDQGATVFASPDPVLHAQLVLRGRYRFSRVPPSQYTLLLAPADIRHGSRTEQLAAAEPFATIEIGAYEHLTWDLVGGP